MHWLMNISLDSLSEMAAEAMIWWSQLTEGIADDQLQLYTYVGASVIALLSLWFIIRMLPRCLHGFLTGIWLFAAALLLAPGDTLLGSGQMAPAVAGVAYSILMKDYSGAATLSLPILTVFVCLLLLNAAWQLIKSLIEQKAAKAKELAEIQEQKRQLALELEKEKS